MGGRDWAFANNKGKRVFGKKNDRAKLLSVGREGSVTSSLGEGLLHLDNQSLGYRTNKLSYGENRRGLTAPSVKN